MAFWSRPDPKKIYGKADPWDTHTTNAGNSTGAAYTAVAYDERHPGGQFWALSTRADWAMDVAMDMARKAWAGLDEKDLESRMKNAVVHWWNGRVGPWKK